MQDVVDGALAVLPTYAGWLLPVLGLALGLIVATWGVLWIRGRYQVAAAFLAVATYAVSYVGDFFGALAPVLGVLVGVIVFGIALTFLRQIGR